MDWLQNLDETLFRFINQSLSNPLFDAVMPWFSGNKLFVPVAALAAAALIWASGRKGLLCVVMIAIAIHVDALKPGSRVLLVDDLLATGGTAAAAAALVQRLGAKILEIGFLIELKFLNGRDKLKGHPVRSLVVY